MFRGFNMPSFVGRTKEESPVKTGPTAVQHLAGIVTDSAAQVMSQQPQPPLMPPPTVESPPLITGNSRGGNQSLTSLTPLSDAMVEHYNDKIVVGPNATADEKCRAAYTLRCRIMNGFPTTMTNPVRRMLLPQQNQLSPFGSAMVERWNAAEANPYPNLSGRNIPNICNAEINAAHSAKRADLQLVQQPPPSTSALTWEPNRWNDFRYIYDENRGTPMGIENEHGIQKRTNCYAYALNLMRNPVTGESFYPHTGMRRRHPGLNVGVVRGLEPMPNSRVTLRRVRDGVRADIEHLGWGFKEVTIDTPVPNGSWMIAMAVDPGSRRHDGDYHFWRLDDCGNWSHKPGHLPVEQLPAGSTPLTIGNRGYGTDRFTSEVIFAIISPKTKKGGEK